MTKQVLLADDAVFLRDALRALLEGERFRVVAEASDGVEAVNLVRRHRVDVALLQAQLPLVSGLEAARQIRSLSPRTAIILLGDGVTDGLVVEALRHGVRGFVLKAQDAADLIKAVHEVARGGIYVAPAVAGAVLAACRVSPLPAADGDRLTPRGRQVLRLVAEGKTTKQIAGLLRISVKTADYHRTQVMRRLDVHDTAGLVRYAIRTGILPA